MHEWLSGGVSPCQGEGRGFESRLVLEMRFEYLKIFEFSLTITYSKMHEWLSGGVSPCQGEGRGFESRLVLFDYYKGETFKFCPFFKSLYYFI